jgi:hypothetical protein
MTDYCERSPEVLRAAQTGAWSEQIGHLAACDICVNALVAYGLRAQAEGCPDLRSLPDPDLIWFRAEATGRGLSLERAMAPLRIGSLVAGALGTLGTAGLLAWFWSGLHFDKQARMPAESGLYAVVLIVGVMSILALSMRRAGIGSAWRK